MTASRFLAAALLAACGGEIRAGVDARPSDAPPDTLIPSVGPPSATSVAITVTSALHLDMPGLLRNVGVPNLAVYFQNPDSSVLLAATTDDRGIAWAELGGGGFVTVIAPRDATGATPITTFASVAPGDRLTLELQPYIGGGQVVTTFDVQTPYTGAGSGRLAGYEVHNSCGDTVTIDTKPNNVVAFNGCGATNLIDVVVVPIDSDGVQLAALYAPNVDIGAPTDPDPDAPVTRHLVVGGTYEALTALTVGYMNAPAGVSFLKSYRAILGDNGRPYDASAGTLTGPTGVNVQFPAPVPAALVPPSTARVLTVTDELPDSPLATGEQLLYTWGMPDVAPINLVNQVLPTYGGNPTYSLPMHQLTWMYGLPGKITPNFVRGQIHVFRDDIPEGRAWSWRIAAPIAGTPGTTLVLPKLPNDGFDFNPADKDAVSVQELTIAAVPGGYSAILRAQAFKELTTSVITTPSGSMQVELLYSPPL